VSGALARLRGLIGLSLFLMVLLMVGTGAVSAQLQADGMVLSVSGETGVLELAGDRSVSLILPSRGQIDGLAALGALDSGREWIAAGSAPDDAGRHLFLLTGDGESSRMLPAPPGQAGVDRRSPVLLVRNETLLGIAWLEGDTASSLSVRAAAWDGGAWQDVETVSAPGPGSQTGLSGAVLADGSWLLAWSAVDGEDDEIVWSRRAGDRWTPVRPVSENNHVPDVSPVLTAAGTGALLAWSRYDGEDAGGYRLRTASFDGDGWRGERPAGPVHSMYPSFVRDGGHLYLLYLSARPRSWSVLELSASGQSLRRASALSALDERPVVGEGEGGGLRLRWPAAKWEADAAWEKLP
jgi:hypothetical protein